MQKNDGISIIHSDWQKIRMLRQEKGMTQQSLADECDIEKPNLSRIENGNTNPTIKSLWKISNALNIKLKDLIDIEY